MGKLYLEEERSVFPRNFSLQLMSARWNHQNQG